jgi:alcohol dehydrogenase class IV
MTVSAPGSVTVSAGMDALVHSVESYVAKAANSISRGFSREGFRRVMRWLPHVVRNPDDLEGRLDLQIGAFFAGAGLMNSGAGPAGALSYPLGARFGVPHGMAGGFFLAPVAVRNVDEGAEVYADLAELLPEPPPREAPAMERSRAVADAIASLSRELDVPGDLGHFGIGRDDIDMIVEQTFLLKPALDMNPVPVDDRSLRSLLEGLAA